MAPLRVLISGGGIAGNALAFWLSKLGHDVTVVERYPSLRATGLQLDLRGHGIEVMKRMGLEEAFRTKRAPEQGIQVVDESGRRRAFFAANRTGKGLQNFTTDWEIMRGDLCRLMYDASVEKRAKYVFGTSIDTYEQKEGSVEVRFADGKSGRYDLLVGAEGQNSRTRRKMLGGGPDGLHPLGGSYTGYFTMRRPLEGGEEYMATWYKPVGHRFVMTRRHSPEEIQVYLLGSTDLERLQSVRRGDIKEEKKLLDELFRGAGWKTDEFLEALKSDNDLYFDRLSVVKLEAWSSGRVVLIGDTAHCPSTMTGMGTTSAMVGAYILAGEIGKHCGRVGKDRVEGGHGGRDNVAAALEAYERTFRPFMDQVQRGLLDGPPLLETMPSSRFGIEVMNSLIGVASFLRLNLTGRWWLRESVNNWNLPDYEELLQD